MTSESKSQVDFSSALSRAEFLLSRGDVISAGRLCQEVLKENPREGAAWALWGNIMDLGGSHAEAVKCFLRAIECDKSVVAYYFSAGQQYLRLSDAPRAIVLLEKAREMEPDSPKILHALGRANSYTGEYVKSSKLLKRALELAPDNLELYEQLAFTLEKMNHLDEALATINKGIARAPGNVDFRLALAKLQLRDGQYDTAEKNLDIFTEDYRRRKNLRTPEKLKFSTALSQKAKILERKKLFEAAYQFFAKGRKLLAEVHSDTKMAMESAAGRKSTGNSFDDLVEKSRRWFSTDKVRNWPKDSVSKNKPPLFLVGFPRSGTTLMGNILAAHRNVLTLQEEGIIEWLIENMGRLIDAESDYPKILSELTAEQINLVQQTYLAEAAKRLGTNNMAGKTIVDKMPLNNVNLGAIYRIFPNAKILSLLRDPRDVCWSCFIQSFNYNPATAHFDTLANTVDIYSRVMELYLLYKKILPMEIIFEVKYEDLIADQEGITRKILEFAGEEWDDNVLQYYSRENNQYVSTPSYEGVMKPIYKTAAGKWKNYQKYFTPHLEKLQPFVKIFGYE